MRRAGSSGRDASSWKKTAIASRLPATMSRWFRMASASLSPGGRSGSWIAGKRPTGDAQFGGDHLERCAPIPLLPEEAAGGVDDHRTGDEAVAPADRL